MTYVYPLLLPIFRITDIYDYCNQIGIKITGIAEELKGEVNQNQSKQTIADPF